MLPTVIVKNASTQSTCVAISNPPKPYAKIRSSTANPAAFGPTEKNAVTGVGAPEYTSGTHVWNGTAAILNPKPIRINVMPVIR